MVKQLDVLAGKLMCPQSDVVALQGPQTSPANLRRNLDKWGPSAGWWLTDMEWRRLARRRSRAAPLTTELRGETAPRYVEAAISSVLYGCLYLRAKICGRLKVRMHSLWLSRGSCATGRGGCVFGARAAKTYRISASPERLGTSFVRQLIRRNRSRLGMLIGFY